MFLDKACNANVILYVWCYAMQTMPHELANQIIIELDFRRSIRGKRRLERNNFCIHET